MDVWREEQVESLVEARDEQGVFRVIAAAARNLGFDYCAYGMRSAWPITRPRTVVLSNYDPEWQRIYAERRYMEIDPTVPATTRSVLPTVWSNAMFDSAPEFWEEARAFGLRHGWAQSSIGPDGTRGMLTLARSGEAIDAKELRRKSQRLVWLTQLAHHAMSRCLGERFAVDRDEPLSARELEVLKWTAEGKTASEIAQIVLISERTVNFHINNAVLKLNTANKTAAVVRAALLGLLN